MRWDAGYIGWQCYIAAGWPAVVACGALQKQFWQTSPDSVSGCLPEHQSRYSAVRLSVCWRWFEVWSGEYCQPAYLQSPLPGVSKLVGENILCSPSKPYSLNCHEGAMTMFDKLCRKGWSSSAHRTAKWGLLVLDSDDIGCGPHCWLYLCKTEHADCTLFVGIWPCYYVFFCFAMFLLLILLCYILYYPTSALFARRIFRRLFPIHSSCISCNTYDYPVSLVCVWLFRC